MTESFSFIGHNLKRPECVLTTRAGNIYVSDFRGGITQIDQQGKQTFYGGKYNGYGKLQPNGIALQKDGSFLIAHLGSDCGGVFKITRNNIVSPVLTQVDGIELPPTNFVHIDHQNRIWVTVSTRLIPRALAYRSDIRDGFIVAINNGEAKVVANNIGYTNEVYVTPDGKHLFVNATFSRELIRYTIEQDCTLTSPKIICHFSEGIFPDGLTMDSEGFLWIVSILSNRIIRINPNTGSQEIIIEDYDQQHLEWIEQAYENNAMERKHLDTNKSNLLQNISSIAFGGKDLKTIYLGCLLGDKLAYFNSHVSGIPPVHWSFDD